VHSGRAAAAKLQFRRCLDLHWTLASAGTPASRLARAASQTHGGSLLLGHRSISVLSLLALAAALPALHALPAAAQSSGGLTATINIAPSTVSVGQNVDVTYTVPPASTGTSTTGLTTSSIDFGDGTTIDGGSAGPGGTLSGDAAHAYSSAGSYTVTVTAQAPDGETVSATAPVTVVSQLQPPAVQLQGPSSSVQPGDSVSFTYSVTPSSGASVGAMVIDYGDGNTDTLTASSGTISHVYASAGAYAVLLMATDSSGQIGAASTIVQVGS
jgi:hypothetical protein